MNVVSLERMAISNGNINLICVTAPSTNSINNYTDLLISIPFSAGFAVLLANHLIHPFVKVGPQWHPCCIDQEDWRVSPDWVVGDYNSAGTAMSGMCQKGLHESLRKDNLNAQH